MVYGPTTFRFTDSPGTTLRLDLNLTTGWMLGQGLDLGVTTAEKLFLTQPPYDGAVLASSYRPPVQMVVPLILTKQATFAAMKTLYDALVVELDRETNTIKYRPQGAAVDYLIDTYRADIPSLLKGDPAPSPFVLMQTTTNLVLNIQRAPDFRSAAAHL